MPVCTATQVYAEFVGRVIIVRCIAPCTVHTSQMLARFSWSYTAAFSTYEGHSQLLPPYPDLRVCCRTSIPPAYPLP